MVRHTAAPCVLAVCGMLAACGDSGQSDDACDGGACEDANATHYVLRDGAVHEVSEDRACAMQSTEASPGLDKQVDILFVIDNSGSMSDEIAAIRRNINQSFAQIIEESRVDYRVIVLSRYGWEGNDVCIEPPLAGAPCSKGLFETNGPRFFHFNWPIDSLDPWCKLLYAFDTKDPDGRAPNGLRAWLRPEAWKVIVMITDDSASCTFGAGEDAVRFGMPVGVDPFEDALLFHQTLLALAPEQLGEPPDVRYQFYSIVGLTGKDAVGEPYFPHEPIEDGMCDTAASPGKAYQALSVITDALRYPVCEGRDFDAVFRVLARSVVEAAKAECSFELPAAPPGQAIDRLTVNVEYTPGDGSAVQRIRQVETDAQCDAEAFVIRGERIELCKAACDRVQADRSAALRVLYGCTVKLE